MEEAIGGMATNNSSASLSGSTRQAAVPEMDSGTSAGYCKYN